MLFTASMSFLILVFLAVFGVYFYFSVLTGNSAPMSTRRKLMLATWSEPSEGTVFGVLNCNADPLLSYLEKRAQTGNKISVTTAVLKAVSLSRRAGPGLNCALAFGKFIKKPTIDGSCLVALEDGKDLAAAKIKDADRKSLDGIHDELKMKADKLRKRQDADFEASKPMLKLLPVFLIEPLVTLVGYLSGALGLEIGALGVRPFPFGTCMVTSVGMLGVEQAFVPFSPFARVPLLIMVGAVMKKPVVDNDNKIIVQNQISLTATLDHRYADGTEVAKLAKKLKEIIEHPNLLEDS